MSFLSFDSASLLSALDSFKVSDSELANKTGGSAAVTMDDLMVKVADGGAQGTIIAGSDKAMSSGLNRMAAGSALPSFKGQGLTAPEGSSNLFIMADARAVDIYGLDASNVWRKLDSVSAKGSKSYSMGSEFTHDDHGAITISEIFVRDPSATADSRGIFRVIPQGGAVIGGGSSGYKNSFSKGVEMGAGLGISGGTLSVESADVAGNTIFMAGDSGDVTDVSGDPLASWTVDCNLFRGVGSLGIESTENAGSTIFMAGDSGDVRNVSGDPLASWTVDCNLFRGVGSLGIESTENAGSTIFMAGDSGDVRNVSGDPLASWTVDCNLFRPSPTVVGAAPPFAMHVDHGVVMGSPNGTAYAMSVDDSGNISATAIVGLTFSQLV